MGIAGMNCYGTLIVLLQAQMGVYADMHSSPELSKHVITRRSPETEGPIELGSSRKMHFYTSNYSQIYQPPADDRPYFVTSLMDSHVKVPLGSAAFLRCRVENQGSYKVAWIRAKDHKILSVQDDPFTSDGRYVVSQSGGNSEYCLIIRYVTHADAGIYICDLGTEPPQRFEVNMTVVEYKAALHGPDLAELGGTLRLRCEVIQPDPQLPIGQVRWYHQGKPLIYDNNRFKLMPTWTDKSSHSHNAQLEIQDVTYKDAGKYSCASSGIMPQSLHVEVYGMSAAAMTKRAAVAPHSHHLSIGSAALSIIVMKSIYFACNIFVVFC